MVARALLVTAIAATAVAAIPEARGVEVAARQGSYCMSECGGLPSTGSDICASSARAVIDSCSNCVNKLGSEASEIKNLVGQLVSQVNQKCGKSSGSSSGASTVSAGVGAVAVAVVAGVALF
ncbi:hypothetical protein Q8F55_004486 [Vanrija albida]|uniref:Extracellular membrane protein CFEM domain-containing protein n=1 Tax=Vanrija albida TaxID=181172 RepID=A0ABR3Q6W5_9TREE